MKKVERKKILFFIESFSGGGAERVLLTILRNLNLSKYDVSVLVMTDAGVYKEDFQSLEITIIPVLHHNAKLLNNIKYKLLHNSLPAWLASRWLFGGLRADTYVAFVEGFCTKMLSHLSTKRRKIAWVHTDLINHPWTIEKGVYQCKNEEAIAYKKMDKIIGVSHDASNVLINQYGLSNVDTIYNPVDESRINQMSDCQLEEHIDQSFFNIVSIGRLTKPKGYDKLVNLMPKILENNPSIRLYIIGEGEERGSLEMQINKLGLKDSVILTGFLKNPYSLIKGMDLFVCSSVAEGFSLVVAEAMIIGLPVVSMECSGPSELLGYGRYGTLCSSYSELSDTIIELSHDKTKLNQLIKKSQIRALDFNTKSIIDKIEEIL